MVKFVTFKVLIALVLIVFRGNLLSKEIPVKFSCEGTLVSESKILPVKAGRSVYVTHFIVNYDNGQWRIQTERKGDKYCVKSDVGSTNADIFSISYVRHHDSTNWNFAGATARPGPIPYVVLDSSVAILWLAFISREIFKNDGMQMLPRIFYPYSPALHNAQFFMPMEVSHHTAVPFFLSRIIMFTDKWRYWEDPIDEGVKPPLEKALPQPYENGYSNCVYYVKEFASGDKVSWPTKFTLTEYGRKPMATSSNDLTEMTVVNGTVDQFDSQPAGETFIPKITPGMLVTEQRFIWDEDLVLKYFYNSTGKWLTKHEVTNTVEYKQQKQKQSKLLPVIKARPAGQPSLNIRKDATHVRIFVLIISGVIFVTFIFIVKLNIKPKTKHIE